MKAESGLLETLAVEDHHRIFDVHVKGRFLTLKYLLPTNRSSYVTGQTLVADGGYTTR